MRYPALRRWRGRRRCAEREARKSDGRRTESGKRGQGRAEGGAGKRGSRMTPWPGTYGAPRLLGPTPDSQSFYQKANPEEEAKSVSLSLDLPFSLLPALPFSLSLSSAFSSYVHLCPPQPTWLLSQPILILLLILPPPPAPPPTLPPPARLAPLPPPSRRPIPPRVTLYLLPLVGCGACPYRVCYYYLTLSIIPKRAGSPLRDCDSPRD